MIRLLRLSSNLAVAPSVPVAVLALSALLLAAPPVAAAPASTPTSTEGLSQAPESALVDAFSAPEIARTARTLPLGGRLRLEGIVLDPSTPSAQPEGLELHRVEVFTPDAEIVVHGADGVRHQPVPDDAFFRGTVVGHPGSLAFLAVHKDGAGRATVRGTVRLDGRLSLLREGTAPEGGEPALVARSAEPLDSVDLGASTGEGFRCESGELTPPPIARDGSNLAPWLERRTTALAPKATAASYTAQVAIETDYELYQRFGNTTSETNYITDLIGFSSTLYDAEIATDLQISYLSLWTTSSDPWTQSNPFCALLQLGRYWNNNHTGVTRTITHMMSGRSGKSGIAWVGVLCQGPFTYNHGGACPGLSPQTDNYGGGYGYTAGIDASFNPASPAPVWDIIAVTHEIGHNFNSPHTHCYNGIGGSSNPVDQCYNGEASSGCYSGPTSLPCSTAGAGCGTIMSYCHLLSGGLANIAFSFGTDHPYGVLPQRVPDRMRAHADATASFSSCLDRIVYCNPLTLGHTGPGADPSVTPTHSTGCSAGEFAAGESVTLTAQPSSGYAVYAWTGTDHDGTTALSNTLTFPAQSHAVSVDYCSELVLSGQTVTGTVSETLNCTILAGNGYKVGNGGDVTLIGRRVVLESGFSVDGTGATLVLGTQ